MLHLAWQLLCQAPDQLLRRFPIITIEDACLHPDMAFFVWCMVARGKGWSLTRQQVAKILQIIHAEASTSCRDMLSEKYRSFANPLLSKHSMSPEVAALVASLIFRANFGGSQFDQGLLKRHAVNWAERFNVSSDQWLERLRTWFPPASTETRNKIEVLLSDYPPPLSNAYRISEGIDNHCFPNLLKRLADRFPCAFIVIQRFRRLKKLAYSEKKLGSAIWNHRSGVNVKKPLVVNSIDGSDVVLSNSPPTIELEHQAGNILLLVTIEEVIEWL